MRAAHTHQVLVNINSGDIHIAELELVHHVVVHLLGVHTRLSVATAYRCDLISQTGQLHVRFQAQIIVVTHGRAEVHRAFPLVRGQHLHDHHFRARVHAFFLKENLFAGGCLDVQLVGRQIIIAFAGLRARIVRTQEIERFLNADRLSQTVIHAGDLIGTRHEILVFPADRQGLGLVVRTFHLRNIPIRLEITEVADTQVGSHFLHFLVVPQGESVVIAV